MEGKEVMRGWNDQVPIDELCAIDKHNFVVKLLNTNLNGKALAQRRKREPATQAELHMYFSAPCPRTCGVTCAYAVKRADEEGYARTF